MDHSEGLHVERGRDVLVTGQLLNLAADFFLEGGDGLWVSE